MRKQDIKVGVVYAYQRGKYGNPEPIVFLNAPKDSQLYKEKKRLSRARPDTPAFTKAPQGATPHASRGAWSSYGDTGYPAVMPYRHGEDDAATPEDLLAVTLADFEATTQTIVKGVLFTVVTSLTPILGEWSEVVTAHEARKRAEREQRQREGRHAAGLKARASAAIAAMGVPAEWYGSREQVVMSLESAEKLAALLSKTSIKGDGECLHGWPAGWHGSCPECLEAAETEPRRYLSPGAAAASVLDEGAAGQADETGER